MNPKTILILSAAIAFTFQGCTTTEGAFGGGAIGALAGQAIGHDTGATLIGAGVGALAGAVATDHVNNQRARAYDQGYSAGYYDAPAPPPPVYERSYYRPVPPPPPAPTYYYRRSHHHRGRVVVVPPPPPGAVIIYP